MTTPPQDAMLSRVNMLLRRWEWLNIPETLTTFHFIHTKILNIIVTEHDFVLNSNHPCLLPLAEPICKGLGWPGLQISAVEINQIFDVYRSWKDVSLDLGDSEKMLERIRNVFNI